MVLPKYSKGEALLVSQRNMRQEEQLIIEITLQVLKPKPPTSGWNKHRTVKTNFFQIKTNALLLSRYNIRILVKDGNNDLNTPNCVSLLWKWILCLKVVLALSKYLHPSPVHDYGPDQKLSEKVHGTQCNGSCWCMKVEKQIWLSVLVFVTDPYQLLLINDHVLQYLIFRKANILDLWLPLCLGICHRRAALRRVCHFSDKLSTSAKPYSELDFEYEITIWTELVVLVAKTESTINLQFWCSFQRFRGLFSHVNQNNDQSSPIAG